MRRDVQALRQFYGGPLGRAVTDRVESRLQRSWGPARGLDVLGVGFATPFMEPFTALARRVVFAMPAGQGVEAWPSGDPNTVCLSGELSLPFQNALFDRVALIHALEESGDATALLREVRRVMSPSGRLLAVAAHEGGLWARSAATPFGHGRAFSRRVLIEAVREAGLEPTGCTTALYLPPVAAAARWSAPVEAWGERLAPTLGGVVVVEAIKQTFAVRPRGAAVPVRAPRLRVPQPVPAPARVRR